MMLWLMLAGGVWCVALVLAWGAAEALLPVAAAVEAREG